MTFKALWERIRALRRPRPATVTLLLTVFSAVIGVAGFLFGPGILLAPRFRVEVKAFSYPTPERLTVFQGLLQMATTSEEVFESAIEDTAEELRQSGLGEEKVQIILSHIHSSLFGSDSSDAFSVFQAMQEKLSKSEIRLAALAYIKALSRAPEKMSRSFFAMPNAIVQFTIVNTGLRDAENVVISMAVQGTCIEGWIQSDNPVDSHECHSDRIRVELKKLNPKAGVAGIFWFYYFGEQKRKSAIAVSSTHKYIRREFSLDWLGENEARPLAYEVKPRSPSTESE